MKKIVLCIVLAALFVPACVRKKDKIVKPVQKVQMHAEDLSKGTTYDEDVGAFVLEDDANRDIFAEAHDVHKGEVEHVLPSPTQQQGDLDDAWAWQELDEEQPTQVIHFDYDSAVIRPDQDTIVRYNAQLAKAACEDGARIVIEGHSCLITRSQIYNQALSQRRADAIKRRFVELGVPGKYVKAVGRGTSCLITHDEGKEGQAPNRRVEVKFIYPQGAKSVKHEPAYSTKALKTKKLKTTKAHKARKTPKPIKKVHEVQS
jgi:outer membrane protein OmpA-like peptidoglycan-associated protein